MKILLHASGRRGLIRAVTGLICAGLFLFQSGCVSGKSRTSGVEGSGGVTVGPGGQIAESKYVVINNKDLARGVQVVDIQTKFVGDLIMASVAIINKYDTTLNVQFRFTWYDDKGSEIPSSTDNWAPVIIYGNETKSLQGMAPNKKASTYKVHIRKM